jgi:mono/diheme cytochrome c family protein
MPTLKSQLLGLALTAALLGLAACASPSSAGPSASAGPGSPAAGFAYAEETCATCHAIAASELTSPHMNAPSFEAIADTPGMTSIAFSAWMRSSHPTMPDLMIEQDKIDDIWAYIETLKGE